MHIEDLIKRCKAINFKMGFASHVASDEHNTKVMLANIELLEKELTYLKNQVRVLYDLNDMTAVKSTPAVKHSAQLTVENATRQTAIVAMVAIGLCWRNTPKTISVFNETLKDHEEAYGLAEAGRSKA